MHKALGRSAVAVALLLATAGCAQVDLDNLSGATPSPTPSAHSMPTGLVTPSVLPSAQPTAASRVRVAFPTLPGYTVDPAATPSAAPTVHARVSQRDWSSRTTQCSLSAQVVSSPELAVAGGDDRYLSQAWADSLGSGYRAYDRTSQLQLTGLNDGVPYAGVGTAFSAKVSGSIVSGKSFVRVWSADGVAVSLTQVCQQGAFDEATWQRLVLGLTISGLSGTTSWPSGEPTTVPTVPAATATPTSDPLG